MCGRGGGVLLSGMMPVNQAKLKYSHIPKLGIPSAIKYSRIKQGDNNSLGHLFPNYYQ